MFEPLPGAPNASRWVQARNRLGTIARQKPDDVGTVDHERDRIEHDHSAQPEPEASRSGNFGRTGYEEREQGGQTTWPRPKIRLNPNRAVRTVISVMLMSNAAIVT